MKPLCRKALFPQLPQTLQDMAPARAKKFEAVIEVK
jgi:hypothetical protein